jgi:hypothetical protein
VSAPAGRHGRLRWLAKPSWSFLPFSLSVAQAPGGAPVSAPAGPAASSPPSTRAIDAGEDARGPADEDVGAPRRESKFWNPYLAGIALGLVLLSAFLVMGHGLGASGAATRFGQFVTSGDTKVLDDWLVFEVLGVFLGGLIGAYSAGRLRLGVIKGAGVGTAQRLAFAFGGGVLMGLAARAARGCTSGQALTGGAVMSIGAWIFMLSVFAGGYGLAWFVRRQWQP